MDNNQVKGAATGLLMLGLALTGALFALAVATPSAEAHTECYSTTPDGCGNCTDTRQAHSHYATGPAPVPWCYWDPSLVSLPCDFDCIASDGFRLSQPTA